MQGLDAFLRRMELFVFIGIIEEIGHLKVTKPINKMIIIKP